MFQFQVRRSLTAIALALFAVALPVLASAEEEAAPTVNEQILSLEAMCEASAEARTARHAEKSLYERLGGEEKIHECMVEILRLHAEDPSFDRFMGDVDQEKLANSLTQFIVAGTGGGGHYEGKAMPEAHEHLELTNADFLAAGGDVMEAMQSVGYGEEEIQEIVCVLVSLRAAVVIEADKVLQ